MYRVAYMYVPPPPPRRTRSCLVPPWGVDELTIPETHRRQPVEGSMESTDQVTALTASDQYTEGILLSAQVVCIVGNLSSVQVACIVIYIAIVSSAQCGCILEVLSSVQVTCTISNLSSVQVTCIIIYVVILSSTQ